MHSWLAVDWDGFPWWRFRFKCSINLHHHCLIFSLSSPFSSWLLCWLPLLPSSSFIALIVIIHHHELSRKILNCILHSHVALHKRKKEFKHVTTFWSRHLITVIKDEGVSLQLRWVECTCYTEVGKIAFSAWAERALAGPVNGSCPPNPVPTSFCCQAPWVNAGMEKWHFLYKPHLFYIRHSQQPQKGHFLASRKPARTINRMCLTCSPNQFSQTCILSPCGFLILHLCEAFTNIWLAWTKLRAVFPVPLRGL